MRKAIAILLLAVFFTMQYGKLVSYWHCRIVALVETAKCDCEKILVNHPSGIDHSTAPVITEKTEEIYWLHETTFDCIPFATLSLNNFPSYTSHLPEFAGSTPFQPPRA